jgi:hypothetical protein
MACKNCGKPAPWLLELCDTCTVEAMSTSATASRPVPVLEGGAFPPEPRSGDPGMMMFWGVCGGTVGVVLGYLFRPSVPLLGQLPFSTVITRGANLKGFDQLLTSTAQESFNYVVIGALICGAIAAAIGAMQKVGESPISPRLASPVPAPVSPVSASAQSSHLGVPITVELGQTRDVVVSILGMPGKVVELGPKTIYVYSDLKITFREGRVADVQ